MKEDLKGFVPLKNYEKTHLINKDTQKIYSIIKRKVLKGTINGGYLKYSLKNADGIVKTRTYHRLLMETFVENPNNYPCINHIDGNKLNNSLDNLEWCSISHNNKEAYRLGLRKVSEKIIQQFMRDCHTPRIIEQGIENLRKSKRIQLNIKNKDFSRNKKYSKYSIFNNQYTNSTNSPIAFLIICWQNFLFFTYEADEIKRKTFRKTDAS